MSFAEYPAPEAQFPRRLTIGSSLNRGSLNKARRRRIGAGGHQIIREIRSLEAQKELGYSR